MGFQTAVQLQQAPAVAGDFASANPRRSFVGPEGGFVAGAAGVTVGRFCWIQSDGKTVLNTGTGKPDGFIHREQQALITTYLAENGSLIPTGFPVTIMQTGDYWVPANVSSAVLRENAYAKFQDGSVRFEASAPASASITAAQSGTTLTVSAVASGTILVGDLVTQASGSVAYVTAQLTGTTGGVGTYTLSVSQTVASGAATSTSYVETDFVCTQAAAIGELAVMSL